MSHGPFLRLCVANLLLRKLRGGIIDALLEGALQHLIVLLDADETIA